MVDLLKSLDHIRFRKAANGLLPARFTENRRAFKCPICDTAMNVYTEADVSETGRSKMALHEMECGCCGMKTERLYSDSKGYDPTIAPIAYGPLARR